jgi:hypothetical protein
MAKLENQVKTKLGLIKPEETQVEETPKKSKSEKSK